MPDLLLELFCEEIPARMQRRAAEELKRLVTDALVERGLLYEGAIAHVTPRRLALHVAGLPVKGADATEERRGPRVGAPEAALKGFLKSAGLTDIGQAHIVKDEKKGEFYAARIEKPGEATIAAIADDRAFGCRELSLAEIDALRPAIARDGFAALGAPAAFHPVHIRSRDRGP